MSDGQDSARTPGTIERLVLGIETSCDETAAAVVLGRNAAPRATTLSNVITSQDELHREYRGVVPEIASRAHAERLLPAVRAALRLAGIPLAEVAAIAVGTRPGLIGSLLIGVSAAKGLAWSLGVPLVGVDHVHAHLYSGLLDREPVAFPAIGLVISGGHTAIYRCESPLRVERLGCTIDDAVGEAYDKVAAMLSVEYPGGPNLDRIARSGDDRRFEFPVSRLGRDSLDFSFSGLKTSVLYTVRGAPGRSGTGINVAGDPTAVADVAASFQRAAARAVLIKVERALEAAPSARSLLVGGGVSANSRIRDGLSALADSRGLDLRLPEARLCTDNAAMIAGLGWEMLEARGWAGDPLEISASPAGGA